jgi:hypothetical protein
MPGGAGGVTAWGRRKNKDIEENNWFFLPVDGTALVINTISQYHTTLRSRSLFPCLHCPVKLSGLESANQERLSYISEPTVNSTTVLRCMQFPQHYSCKILIHGWSKHILLVTHISNIILWILSTTWVSADCNHSIQQQCIEYKIRNKHAGTSDSRKHSVLENISTTVNVSCFSDYSTLLKLRGNDQ